MEIWKTVNGFPKYKISNRGRVISLHSGREKYLLPEIDRYGYARVVLCHNGYHKRKLIHRLVAEHFLECPDNYEELTIDHLDYDKTNNRPENLEWVTSSENLRRAHKEGRYDATLRRHMIPIIVTDLWTGDEKYYENVPEAARDLRIPKSSIYATLRRSNYVIDHYAIEYAGREERLLYGLEWCDLEDY